MSGVLTFTVSKDGESVVFLSLLVLFVRVLVVCAGGVLVVVRDRARGDPVLELFRSIGPDLLALPPRPALVAMNIYNNQHKYQLKYTDI